MAAVLVAVFSLSVQAEQWSFFGSAEKDPAAFDFSHKSFTAALSGDADKPLEVFSGSRLASIVPIRLDQLVVSLVDVTPGDGPFAVDKEPFFSQLHLATGIKTETRLTNPQSPLMDELFGDADASFDGSSSLIFIGVGLDFKSGYLKGNAFIGRPLDTLTNRLYNTKTSDSIKNRGLDTDALGFEASAGYKLNEKIALGAGFGRMNDKNIETEQTEKVYAVYAQAILAIAPGINMIPEVGQIERIKEELISEAMDASETRDESFYAGARWEINF